MNPSPTTDLEVPERALAIGAHPDDIEFGSGGTLAKWAAAGCRIFHLVCTDGSKGSWEPGADIAALVATRRDEQREAARRLGGGPGDVAFCGWVDGELASGLTERARVCHWIRTLRPEVVLGHDPWKRYRLHPDHRHAGHLAVEGIVAARDPHFFPEQGAAPHRPRRLLLWEADEADHVEDIEATFETKLEALLAHRSQYATTMEVTDPASAEELATFRQRLRDRAAEHGATAGLALGERFKLLERL